MATLEERKIEYNNHEIAGKDYYNSFRSQLSLDIEDGSKTIEEALSIHKTLKVVGEYLNTGDWKGAFDAISRIGETHYCSKDIIDNMKSDILSYIQLNYTW